MYPSDRVTEGAASQGSRGDRGNDGANVDEPLLATSNAAHGRLTTSSHTQYTRSTTTRSLVRFAHSLTRSHQRPSKGPQRHGQHAPQLSLGEHTSHPRCAPTTHYTQDTTSHSSSSSHAALSHTTLTLTTSSTTLRYHTASTQLTLSTPTQQPRCSLGRRLLGSHHVALAHAYHALTSTHQVSSYAQSTPRSGPTLRT